MTSPGERLTAFVMEDACMKPVMPGNISFQCDMTLPYVNKQDRFCVYSINFENNFQKCSIIDVFLAHVNLKTIGK